MATTSAADMSPDRGDICYDVVQQMPYLSIAGALLLLVGNVLAIAGIDEIALSLASVGLDIGEVRALLAVVLSLTFALGIVAIFVCLLSRGALRECCCGYADGCCLSTLQCCIADLMPRLLCIVSFLVLVLLVVLVIAYTVLFVVLLVSQVVCSAGREIAETLLARLDSVPFLSGRVGTNIDDSKVAAFCAESEGSVGAATRLLVGTVLALLGQVLLLMALNSSLAFNTMERRMSEAFYGYSYGAGRYGHGNGYGYGYDRGYDKRRGRYETERRREDAYLRNGRRAEPTPVREVRDDEVEMAARRHTPRQRGDVRQPNYNDDDYRRDFGV